MRYSMRYFMATLCMVVLMATGCSEDELDRLNRVDNQPPVDVVDARLQLPDAVVSMAFTTFGGGYAWHVASYTEQIFGDGGTQMMYAELRDPVITAAPTTFNNEWNNTYHNLLNIDLIISKCTDGVNAGQLDLKGMAEVLKVMGYSTLTLLHGDIPYTEACNPKIRNPRLDAQKDVYDSLLALTDTAISDLQEALEGGMSNVGEHDLLYKGDVAQWLALAYAVKARLLLDGLARNPESASAVVTAGERAVELGFRGAELAVFNGVEAMNPWAAYFKSRHYSGASATVVRLMEEREDPRLGVYACDTFGTGVLWASPGDAAMASTIDNVGAPAWLGNASAGQHLLSEASLRFVIAEAKLRLGKDAAADFQAGVRASFADYAANAPESAGVKDLASEYLMQFDTVTLGEVMVQKYLSQVRDEQIETYNDLRRLRKMGEEYVKMCNPCNEDDGMNRWPWLLPYGNSDVVSNPNVAAIFGTGNQAGYYIFEE